MTDAQANVMIDRLDTIITFLARIDASIDSLHVCMHADDDDDDDYIDIDPNTAS